MDVRGTGWADAIRFIVEHYKDDPDKMTKVIDELYKGYEDRMDRFWKQDYKSNRKNCWLEYCSKFLDDSKFKNEYLAKNYDYDNISYDSRTNEGMAINQQSTLANAYKTNKSEIIRWARMACSANDQTSFLVGPSWEKVWTADSGYPCNADCLDSISDYQKKAYKNHANEVILQNSNGPIYAVYKTYHDKAIIDYRKKLRNDVLPWLNTRVTFYIKDSSVLSDTNYDTLKFVDGSQKPIFKTSKWFDEEVEFDYQPDTFGIFGIERYSHVSVVSINSERFIDVDEYPLDMSRTDDFSVVLETGLYHYMRFGCPVQVEVSSSTGTLPTVLLKADWDSVPMLPTEKGDIEGVVPFKDYKVPLVLEELKPQKTSTELYLKQYSSINAGNVHRGVPFEQGVKGQVSVDQDGNVTILIPAVEGQCTNNYDYIEKYEADSFEIKGKVTGEREDYGLGDGRSYQDFEITSFPQEVKITMNSDYINPSMQEVHKTKTYTLNDLGSLSIDFTSTKIEYDKSGNIVEVRFYLRGNEENKEHSDWIDYWGEPREDNEVLNFDDETWEFILANN